MNFLWIETVENLTKIPRCKYDRRTPTDLVHQILSWISKGHGQDCSARFSVCSVTGTVRRTVWALCHLGAHYRACCYWSWFTFQNEASIIEINLKWSRSNLFKKFSKSLRFFRCLHSIIGASNAKRLNQEGLEVTADGKTSIEHSLDAAIKFITTKTQIFWFLIFGFHFVRTRSTFLFFLTK